MFSTVHHSSRIKGLSHGWGMPQIIFIISKLYFIKTKKSIILDSNKRSLVKNEQRQDNINQNLIPNLNLNAGIYLSRAIACFTINLLMPKRCYLLPVVPVAGRGVKANCINIKPHSY